MIHSSTGKRFGRAFVVAAAGGFVFALAMLAVNFYIHSHGATNGEHSWMYSFTILQGIPFSLLLGLLDFVGLGKISNESVLCVLASVADCFPVFIFLLILGFIWQHYAKREA